MGAIWGLWPGLALAQEADQLATMPVRVDMRAWAPVPGNQEQINACVPWAAVYGAGSILFAQRQGRIATEDGPRIALSPLFIYNQVAGGSCLMGAKVEASLRAFQTQGSVPIEQFTPADCQVQPSEELKALATSYRIGGYKKLFPAGASETVKIQRMKLMLAQDYPVVVGLNIRRNFRHIRADHPIWEPDQGNTQSEGGHAVCLVGYDEARQSFLVMNSWGPRWGKGGFAWIHYRDMGRHCDYAYTLHLPEASQPDLAPLGGALELRVMDLYHGTEMVQMGEAAARCSRVQLVYDQGEYRPEKALPDPLLFQLLTLDPAPDTYLYIWELGSDTPPLAVRPGDSSPTGPHSGERLIPGASLFLQPSEAGPEQEARLLLMFCRRQIEPAFLDQLPARYAACLGEPSKRLDQLFGERRLPAHAIWHAPDQIMLLAKEAPETTIATVMINLKPR